MMFALDRLPGVALAATLLAGGCGNEAEPGAANEPDAGTLQSAAKGTILRWVGEVEGTDVRVAVLMGPQKLRVFFCGGPESYATATRWFDLETEGEHVEFEDDTWRIHAHALLTGVRGEVELPGDVMRQLNAKSVFATSLAGLYEGTADCGRLGLIVTQDTNGDVTAQGACTRDAGESPQQIEPIEPIMSEQGKIRVQTPDHPDGTMLLQLAGVEPL